MNPATLTAASMGAQALGSATLGRQQAATANYNAKVMGVNAQIADQNAQFVAEEGAVNAGNEGMKTRAQVGAIKAAQAANGLEVNSGSNVGVRQSAAELGELDALTIRSNAARSAYGYQTQAESDRTQADLYRHEAKNAKTAGYIKAGTTLLSEGSKANAAGTWDSWLGKNSLNGDIGGNTDYGSNYLNDFPASV